MPIIMKFGLSSTTIEAIQNEFRKMPEVEEVVIYGSRAKGNFHNGSDIDLTMIGWQLTTQNLFHIDDALDDLMLPYTIDLSILHKVNNADFRAHVERVGKVFYRKN